MSEGAPHHTSRLSSSRSKFDQETMFVLVVTWVRALEPGHKRFTGSFVNSSTCCRVCGQFAVSGTPKENQIVKVSSKSKTENVFHYELLLHTYSCRENIPKKNSLCQLNSAELEKKYHAVKSFKYSRLLCSHRSPYGRRFETWNLQTPTIKLKQSTTMCMLN